MSARHDFRSFAELSHISTADLEAAGRVIRSVSQVIEGAKPVHGLTAGQNALQLAKKLKGLRAIRNAAYPSELFGEPAWDLLLALYIAYHEQYRLKVSNLTWESNVPPTTALRWIDTLIKEGYAKKVANPHDARSSYVEMTESAAKHLTETLNAILDTKCWR